MKEIIQFSKIKDGDYSCLICGKNRTSTKMTINRLKMDDTIISFNVCDECIAKMQKEIETCK